MADDTGGAVRRARTGIPGFDQVCGGGLPAGRITVVLGGPGSGKTIFAAQTLAHGACHEDEPGLFVTFEESPEQIISNMASFDWKLDAGDKGVELLDAQLQSTVINGGDFELSGLLAMLAVRATARGVKRVVFDGLDLLLAHLSDTRLMRREVFRFREWAQSTGVTTIITAKADMREAGSLGDYDFLQFLADCVIVLQQRIGDGTAFRLLQVAKYRGTTHSADEFPFTVGASGIDLGVSTQLELRHHVSNERVSSGVAALDTMLGGGYFRGSSTLITGTPGTAKTTLAAAFADGSAARNERTLLVSFDEAPGAKSLVIDPISALGQSGGPALAEAAAIKLLDLAKSMREMELREREAEFHLAEAKARARAALTQEALGEATLARVRAEREMQVEQAASEHQQLRERRGAEEDAAAPEGQGK